MENDTVLLKADPKGLDVFSHKLGLELKGDSTSDKEIIANKQVSLMEVVVTPDSRMIGRRIGALRLKSRHGLNLLGVSREGQIRKQLAQIEFQSGDVLLVQGDADSSSQSFTKLGLLPLAGPSLLTATTTNRAN